MRRSLSGLFLIALFTAQAQFPNVTVTHFVSIDYPIMARAAHVEGLARFLLQVGRDGSVESVKYVSGDGQGIGLVVDATLRSLKQWRFTPCGGTADECSYPISARFVLEGAATYNPRSRFEFDPPGQITVKSEFQKAIIN
jgi:hypothetical protein